MIRVSRYRQNKLIYNTNFESNIEVTFLGYACFTALYSCMSYYVVVVEA